MYANTGVGSLSIAVLLQTNKTQTLSIISSDYLSPIRIGKVSFFLKKCLYNIIFITSFFIGYKLLFFIQEYVFLPSVMSVTMKCAFLKVQLILFAHVKVALNIKAIAFGVKVIIILHFMKRF